MLTAQTAQKNTTASSRINGTNLKGIPPGLIHHIKNLQSIFPYRHPGCFIHHIKSYVSPPASRCFLKPDNKINKQNKNKPSL